MHQFEDNLIEQQSYYMFYYTKNLVTTIFLRLAMVNSVYLNDIFVSLSIWVGANTTKQRSTFVNIHTATSNDGSKTVQQQSNNSPATVQRPSNHRPTTVQRPSNNGQITVQQQKNKKKKFIVHSLVGLLRMTVTLCHQLVVNNILCIYVD